MTQNFNNAKIYKITNDYNDDIYVGSTCDSLMKRFSKHKRDKKSEVNKNRPLYMLINDIGIERFRIDLIEDYPCVDKMALRQREGHFIREMGTLNMCVAGRTFDEYRQENNEKIQEQKKKYNHENREEINRKNREYSQENKDKIKQYQREYCQRKKLEKENVAI